MIKDKSFLNKLLQISSNLEDPKNKFHLISPRSVQSKLFHRQKISQKKPYQRFCNNEYNIRQFRPKSQLSNFRHQTQNQAFGYNVYSSLKYQQPLDYNFYKRNSSINILDFSRCQQNLRRSKSMNLIYKNQRIEMLKQMNIVLQNHSRQSQKYKIKDTESSNKFKQQICKKIDRLQKYLFKIKRQRQKQQVPRSKLEKIDQKKINNQSIIPNHSKNQEKLKFDQAFLQLEKIQRQLIQIRKQAIQVKQRNSIQKKIGFNRLPNQYNQPESFQKSEKIKNPTYPLETNRFVKLKQPFLTERQSRQIIQNLSRQNTNTSHLPHRIEHQSFNHVNQLKNFNNIGSKSSQRTESSILVKPKVVFSFSQINQV